MEISNLDRYKYVNAGTSKISAIQRIKNILNNQCSEYVQIRIDIINADSKTYFGKEKEPDALVILEPPFTLSNIIEIIINKVYKEKPDIYIYEYELFLRVISEFMNDLINEKLFKFIVINKDEYGLMERHILNIHEYDIKYIAGIIRKYHKYMSIEMYHKLLNDAGLTHFMKPKEET